jgi:hypothetical protein
MLPNVYFSIGDAVAGLGIFLLIPQFLKPIYVFRLRVIGIGLRSLYAMSAFGFICIVIAAYTQYFAAPIPEILRNSLVWETIGGFLYATSYTALGLVYIFPAHVGLASVAKYVRAGAYLLASGSEEDRVEFSADVLANVRKLIRIAGLPSAKVPPLARLLLRLRRHSPADLAAYSESFLRLLADPAFCRTLVRRLPWDAARVLRAFSEEKPATPVGGAFVHQITRNVLLAAEIDGNDEDDWLQFTDAPSLSRAAFGDSYLNRHYLPWEGLALTDLNAVNAAMMERIARAAAFTIDEYVAARFSYRSYNIARMQETFEALSRRICFLKKSDADVAQLAGILGRSVKYIVESTRNFCRNAPPEKRRALYAPSEGSHEVSSIDSIAEIVISVLENTSYEFSGFDDPFWPMAREIWDAVMPRFGSEGTGMDPLQQRVVLKLIEKTTETIEGWYSPLPRQALAIIGPYPAKPETGERSAFKICRDLFYLEFKAYPAFYAKDPERAKSFLPNNVRYDPETTGLIHRYSFGSEDHTNLGQLQIPPASLEIEAIDIRAPAVESAPSLAPGAA